MSYTKREIIQKALVEIGMGAYAFDSQPDDLQDALLRLNTMLAAWASAGAVTGAPTSFTDDIDADSLVKLEDARAVICGLAVDLAPSYGKQVMPHTQATAVAGRKLIITNLAKSSITPKKGMDVAAVPAGAGYKTPDIINLYGAE